MLQCGDRGGPPRMAGTVSDEVRSRRRTEPAYVRHGPKPRDERRGCSGPRGGSVSPALPS